MDRFLIGRAGDGKTEIDFLRVVHADVEHDEENDEEEKGFEDGFKHRAWADCRRLQRLRVRAAHAKWHSCLRANSLCAPAMVGVRLPRCPPTPPAPSWPT